MKQLKNYVGIHRVITGLLFCATTALVAQTSVPVTTGVPTQFATAHTAFLSNAGAPTLGSHEKIGAAMVYESVYKALVADKHYQLTGVPADAELAIEVSIEVQLTDVSRGSSAEASYVRLAVYDVKTHSLLWNLDEPVKGAFRAASFQKNLDETTTKLMEDLHALISGKQP